MVSPAELEPLERRLQLMGLMFDDGCFNVLINTVQCHFRAKIHLRVFNEAITSELLLSRNRPKYKLIMWKSCMIDKWLNSAYVNI